MKKETLEEAAERVAKLKYGPTIYGLERENNSLLYSDNK